MRTILVVDDDALARDIYRSILEPHGFEVIAVGSGGDALRAFEERRFDLVILDLVMPGLDGFEVLERLDPEETGVPVFVVSGSGEDTGAQPLHLAATLGATRTFRKDFEYLALVRAIEEVLAGADAAVPG